MREVTIIGLDLAKNYIQAHGASANGTVTFRRRLTRAKLLPFLADQPPCLVAMEACASAHHWAREMARQGHEVRLIAPHYGNPFRQAAEDGMVAALPRRHRNVPRSWCSTPREGEDGK